MELGLAGFLWVLVRAVCGPRLVGCKVAGTPQVRVAKLRENHRFGWDRLHAFFPSVL